MWYFSDINIILFSSNKIITTSGDEVILTKSKDKIIFLVAQAKQNIESITLEAFAYSGCF